MGLYTYNCSIVHSSRSCLIRGKHWDLGVGGSSVRSPRPKLRKLSACGNATSCKADFVCVYIYNYIYTYIYIYNIYIYLFMGFRFLVVYLAVHARIAGIRCSSSLQMMVSEVSGPTNFFVGEDPM